MAGKYLQLIEDLTQAPGAPGFEDAVIKIARTYCAGFAPLEVDSIRNLYIGRHKNDGKKPLMMLDAHSDEVAFLIKRINTNGTLEIINLGGINPRQHEGTRVLVRNADGQYIPGLISCRPPHYGRDADGQAPVVDIGARGVKEAERDYRIRIGEPCVPDVAFHYSQENDLIFAKALDCRIGCAALLAVMEELQDEELSVDLMGVLTAQEEIGARGAYVAVNKIKPKVAIVFEGAPADDTLVPRHEVQTALKKGPMIRLIDNSMVTNPRFVRFVLNLAEKKGLPVQLAVRSGGGTNAKYIHTAAGSVPTMVISVPVRYSHSPNGLASYSDFAGSVQLAIEVIKELDQQVINSF